MPPPYCFKSTGNADGLQAQLDRILFAARYERGHHFGRHIDESNRVGSRETRYTLLIYLSGGPVPAANTGAESAATAPLKGGETLFYGEPFAKAILLDATLQCY